MVAVISSAGGIPALLQLLGALPPDFQFPIVIAQHLPRNAVSLLADILARRCVLPVEWAGDEMNVEAGRIYVVRPGEALRFEWDHMKVEKQRPDWRGWLTASDALLQSLAEAYGAGGIGVVLSGLMPVGIEGLVSLRRAGGTLVAQSKASAQCFAMPGAACDLAKADLVLSPTGIAKALGVLDDRQFDQAA